MTRVLKFPCLSQFFGSEPPIPLPFLVGMLDCALVEKGVSTRVCTLRNSASVTVPSRKESVVGQFGFPQTRFSIRIVE
jgi:hypothetical protein